MTTFNWYEITAPSIPWLVHGLLANDSHSAFVGKPKSGKSTLVRNLAVSVVKGRDLLGRKVNVPNTGGRVLYIHLDRKDPIHDVADELRKLGITAEESKRLMLMASEDIPQNLESRLVWLQDRVKDFKPQLIIIDLLFQFISVQESNSYVQVLAAINGLQDALRKVNFKGHTVTAHHQRKAVSTQDAFDDILGSSSIRGSFATNVLLVHDRKRKWYTIQTDQTQREKAIGEIAETVIERKSDTGELMLGRNVSDLEQDIMKEEANKDSMRVLDFITNHAGISQNEMVSALQIRKANLTRILRDLKPLLTTEGKGVANDPVRYTVQLPKENVQ